MSLETPVGFKVVSNEPIDDRIAFPTPQEIVKFGDANRNRLYNGLLVSCVSENRLYMWVNRWIPIADFTRFEAVNNNFDSLSSSLSALGNRVTELEAVTNKLKNLTVTQKIAFNSQSKSDSGDSRQFTLGTDTTLPLFYNRTVVPKNLPRAIVTTAPSSGTVEDLHLISTGFNLTASRWNSNEFGHVRLHGDKSELIDRVWVVHANGSEQLCSLRPLSSTAPNNGSWVEIPSFSIKLESTRAIHAHINYGSGVDVYIPYFDPSKFQVTVDGTSLGRFEAGTYVDVRSATELVVRRGYTDKVAIIEKSGEDITDLFSYNDNNYTFKGRIASPGISITIKDLN